VALSDQEWYEQMFPGKVYVGPSSSPPPTSLPDIQIAPVPTDILSQGTVGPTIFPTDEDDDMGWISDVYDVVDASVGGILPGGVPFGSSVPGQVFNQNPVVIDQSTGVSVPVSQAASCADDPMKGMVYKKVCGQYRWVKVKRRRRRALVTHTDLKGLAALKGVLGGGKAFEVWIATHS